jgi:hypothetical protein
MDLVPRGRSVTDALWIYVQTVRTVRTKDYVLFDLSYPPPLFSTVLCSTWSDPPYPSRPVLSVHCPASALPTITALYRRNNEKLSLHTTSIHPHFLHVIPISVSLHPSVPTSALHLFLPPFPPRSSLLSSFFYSFDLFSSVLLYSSLFYSSSVPPPSRCRHVTHR